MGQDRRTGEVRRGRRRELESCQPSCRPRNGGAMAFRFRLYLKSGDDIGSFATTVPDWDVAIDRQLRPHPIPDHEHRVERGPTSDEFDGIFVVTAVALART